MVNWHPLETIWHAFEGPGRYTGKLTLLEPKVMQSLVQMIVLVQLGWFLFGFLAAMLISSGFCGFKDVVFWCFFPPHLGVEDFMQFLRSISFTMGLSFEEKNQRIFPEELGRLEPWNNNYTLCVSEGMGKLMCWSMIHMNMKRGRTGFMK